MAEVRFTVQRGGKYPIKNTAGIFTLYWDEHVILTVGERRRISLGVSMQLPPNTCGMLLRRPDTHKKLDVIPGEANIKDSILKIKVLLFPNRIH